jgi:di/tricarboxylate transporter
MEHIIVFITLFCLLILFATGRIRHDFVALIGLLSLVAFGIIDGGGAFSGFGHPAVITVAAVLIIGKALEQSGLIDWIGKYVLKVGKNITIQILTLSGLAAVASAFMNNVGALAIMMPIAIHLARKSGNSPALVLMPIAFASLLGGMTTLIGTPPNIIIATFRADAVGAPFGMFDFAPVGVVIAGAGIVYIALIGWRLLPKRTADKSEEDLFNIDDYITEVMVTKDSKILGKQVGSLRVTDGADVQLLGIVRNNIRMHIPGKQEVLQENDILIIETDTDDLKLLIAETGVVLVGDKLLYKSAKGSEKISFMEAIVMADSPLLGRTASGLRMRSRYELNLLAVARREQKILRRLDRVIFRSGDVLLLQGYEETLRDRIGELGCLPLAKRALQLKHSRKIPLALGLFVASIFLVVMGWFPVQVAFPMAAVAMVLSGVISPKDVYTSIDWPVIVLLGAMIPVGTAMETSGGAEMIAGGILSLGEEVPSWAMLGIIMVITMFLSDIINNAATVVLMAPIAISVALATGSSIDPYLMAVAIGGSSAFLTPIGHQSNTLVMGPGGYAFGDYWRMGLLLELIILIVGVPLIMMIWPL